MSHRMSWWARLLRAADAIWLTKVIVCLMVYWLLREAATFALGSAFALPLLIALGWYLARELYTVATGHTPRRAPPARLGRPTYERLPNDTP